MKKEKLAEALNEISDRHIAEAAHVKKRHRGLRRFAAVAAILAVVLLARHIEVPMIVTAKAVSLSAGPKTPQRPLAITEVLNEAAYDEAWDAWREAYRILNTDLEATVPQLEGFMSGSRENSLYSPINA